MPEIVVTRGNDGKLCGLTELGKVDARCDGCKHRKDAHE